MPSTYDRDLIGYGANPPNPKWPKVARIAVNFVMNYEEGSEPSFPDGDGLHRSRPDRGARVASPSRAVTSPPRACSNTAAGSASGG